MAFDTQASTSHLLQAARAVVDVPADELVPALGNPRIPPRGVRLNDIATLSGADAQASTNYLLLAARAVVDVPADEQVPALRNPRILPQGVRPNDIATLSDFLAPL